MTSAEELLSDVAAALPAVPVARFADPLAERALEQQQGLARPAHLGGCETSVLLVAQIWKLPCVPEKIARPQIELVMLE